jgi:hypothetical protein
MTTGITSALGYNVTIHNNRVPEFAIAFSDNLEGVLGINYSGGSYKYPDDKGSGSVMEFVFGGRYYLNNVGKISPFAYANFGFLMYFGDAESPYNKYYNLEGGLGFAYNIDSNWAVVGQTGFFRNVQQEKDSDITEAAWFDTYSTGLKYSF